VLFRSPCPINYGRRNKEKSLDSLKMYQKGIIKNGADPATVDLDFEKGIILGTFVNREKPTFYEKYMKINGLE
jgi:2-oxoglutarate ferredoxin oxidoreductase subunit beta